MTLGSWSRCFMLRKFSTWPCASFTCLVLPQDIPTTLKAIFSGPHVNIQTFVGVYTDPRRVACHEMLAQSRDVRCQQVRFLHSDGLPRVMKNSCENFEMQHVNISHMLHGAGIWIQTFTNIYPINHPNAGKYILYMKHLGIYIYYIDMSV